MQDLTVEDLAAAGIYALTRHGLGEGLPPLDQGRFSPPDPRDISECEGLLEVRRCSHRIHMCLAECRLDPGRCCTSFQCACRFSRAVLKPIAGVLLGLSVLRLACASAFGSEIE
jgi:hypothetical protein